MSQLRTQWGKAKAILKTEGMTALLKAIGLFVIERIYYHSVFLLSKNNQKKDLILIKADYRPNISNLTTKVVSSNQQADELEKEGLSFRYYPTDWNYNLTCYTDWLDKGAIAFCTFVGKEL